MGGIEPANAACRLDRDGTLSILVGTVDMSGTNTALAQIAAEAFGLPVEDIRVVNGDSDSAPPAASGGSKITYTVGLAVERAAREARRWLLAVAADRLEAALEDLEIVDRAVQVRRVPGRAVALAELAKASMQFGAVRAGVRPRRKRDGRPLAGLRRPPERSRGGHGDRGRSRGAPPHGAGCGPAINPAAVEGQIQGGVAQGIGWALLERMPYDAQGQLPPPP